MLRIFSLFLNYRVAPYEMPEKCWQIIGPNSVVSSSNLYAPSLELDTEQPQHMTPQTIVQAEWFNKVIIARPVHYVLELERDCFVPVPLRAYTFNSQVPCSTNLLPLTLELIQQPPVRTTLDNPAALPADATANKVRRYRPGRLLHRLSTMTLDGSRGMKTVQLSHTGDHDWKPCNFPLLLTAGQYVNIDRPPLTTSATEYWKLSRKTNKCSLTWFHSE